MYNPEKMVRHLKRRKLRIFSLSAACLLLLSIGIFSYSILRGSMVTYSYSWFADQLTGEHPDTELPLVLSQMYQAVTVHSVLISLIFVHSAFFGVLFGVLIMEIFASPIALKVAMWEKIQKLELEIESIKNPTQNT